MLVFGIFEPARVFHITSIARLLVNWIAVEWKYLKRKLCHTQPEIFDRTELVVFAVTVFLRRFGDEAFLKSIGGISLIQTAQQRKAEANP
jgi:hypothetical protein